MQRQAPKKKVVAAQGTGRFCETPFVCSPHLFDRKELFFVALSANNHDTESENGTSEEEDRESSNYSDSGTDIVIVSKAMDV